MSPPLAKSDQRLLSVIKDLSFCRNVQQVMDVVRKNARGLTGADGVTFVLREGENVYYAMEDAIGPLWQGRRFPATACISGWAMLNRKAAIIEDIYQDPRIPVDAYKPTFVKSLVMMPVRTEDPVAAIGVYWARCYRATTDEVDALQALADSTALALQNVQLYSDLEDAFKKERQARLEAEEASRAKDQWLSVVSHELRTPLTPIFGWVQMLRAKSLDETKTKEALTIIGRNLKSHMRLVEDLLDASRLLTNQFSLRSAKVDLRDCAATAAQMLSGMAEAKGVTLEVAAEDAPLEVTGDPDRLSQIVHNLVHNAIKFTPAGGRIQVSLRRSAGDAELIVQDNGSGITPDVLPRIFSRFLQEDSSTTRSAGGLGLGLWIVRQLTELHGGTVSAHSLGKNKGATFTVRLPLV